MNRAKIRIKQYCSSLRGQSWIKPVPQPFPIIILPDFKASLGLPQVELQHNEPDQTEMSDSVLIILPNFEASIGSPLLELHHDAVPVHGRVDHRVR